VDNLGFIVKRKRRADNSFLEIDSYRNNPELKGMGSSSGKEYAYADYAVLPDNEYIYQVFSVSYSGIMQLVFQTEGIKYSPENTNLPATFSIKQNYPNPFNPSTTIAFSLDEKSRVKISVHTITGALVQVLADREYNSGEHTVLFTPRGALSSSFYICRFQSRSFVKYFKMTYLK